MADLLSHLEKYGVKAALENLLPGSISADLGELVSNVNEINHPQIGVCLDTGHLNVMKGRPADAVRAIGTKLFALHVHDNKGQGDQHQPPFEGNADWSGFVKALEEVGYMGTLNLEVFDQAPLEKMASVDFIRRSLDRAKSLLSS